MLHYIATMEKNTHKQMETAQWQYKTDQGKKIRNASQPIYRRAVRIHRLQTHDTISCRAIGDRLME